MTFGDARNNGESESHAVRLRRHQGLHEGVNLLLRNQGTVVLHFHPPVTVFGKDPHGNFRIDPPLKRVAGVFEEVQNREFDFPTVHFRPEVRRNRLSDQRVGTPGTFERFNGALDAHAHIRNFEFRSLAFGVRPHAVHDFTCARPLIHDLGENLVQHLGIKIAAFAAAQKTVCEIRDRPQRLL